MLTRLRNLLVLKTSSAVEIFLSSDGQSIPLGRNWVHRVEDALSITKVLFVFLSPASLASGWVFFESGYAYSRGIRVIPIATGGVDLGLVSPPMSLLQGFNLTSPDSAANIIAVLNEEFGFSFPAEFTDSEFRQVFGHTHVVTSGPLGKFANVIKSVHITPFGGGQLLLEAASAIADEEGLEYQVDSSTFSTFGLEIRVGQPLEGPTTIKVDPGTLHYTLKIISGIFALMEDRPEKEEIVLSFAEFVESVDDRVTQSGRLYGSGIGLGHSDFIHENIRFSVSTWFQHRGNNLKRGGASITLHISRADLLSLDLRPLLQLLFERGLLVQRQPALGA